jgi:hypothetical protein
MYLKSTASLKFFNREWGIFQIITLILIALWIIITFILGANSFAHIPFYLWTVYISLVTIIKHSGQNQNLIHKVLRAVFIACIFVFVGSGLITNKWSDSLVFTALIIHISLFILIFKTSLRSWVITLPSRKFWWQLLPLVLVIFVLNIIFMSPFIMLMSSFDGWESNSKRLENLVSSVPSQTPFSYSGAGGLVMMGTENVTEEFGRLSMYVTGLSHPILNTAVWVLSHSTQTDLLRMEVELNDRDAKLWLLGATVSRFIGGLFYLWILKREKSIWAAFALHFFSNLIRIA